MRVSSKVHIHPPSPRLQREELLLMSDFRALVKFDSIILELDFTSFTFPHNTETHGDIGVIRVYLELIIGVGDVVLHEYARDTQLVEGLVEVVFDVRADSLFNVVDEEVVVRDVEGPVGDLRRLAV